MYISQSSTTTNVSTLRGLLISGGKELAFAKASQLPARLEEQQRKNKEEDRRLKQDKNRRDEQFYHYFQVNIIILFFVIM